MHERTCPIINSYIWGWFLLSTLATPGEYSNQKAVKWKGDKVDMVQSFNMYYKLLFSTKHDTSFQKQSANKLLSLLYTLYMYSACGEDQTSYGQLLR